MNCPTCGRRVSVSSSDEGTAYYVGEDAAEVERLREKAAGAEMWRDQARALSAEIKRLREALTLAEAVLRRNGWPTGYARNALREEVERDDPVGP